MGKTTEGLWTNATYAAEKVVENFDPVKAYRGTITAIPSSGEYSVYLNGSTYPIKSNFTHSIGDSVLVLAPHAFKNDFSDLYLLP